MSHALSPGQHLYLARRLAKQAGLFIVVKTHRAAHGERTDYLLYREIAPHRPALIGKRTTAAAIHAYVEQVGATAAPQRAPTAPVMALATGAAS